MSDSSKPRNGGGGHGRAVLASARIVALEMELKNIENSILPRLYRQVGAGCLSESQVRETFPDLVAEYERIGQEIQALESEDQKARDEKGRDASTLAGKAVVAADALKRRTALDGLRRKQETVVARIGAGCIDRGIVPADRFADEVEEITSLRQKRDKLNVEINDLRKSVPWYAAHPRRTLAALAIVLILVVGGLFAMKVYLGHGRKHPAEGLAAFDDLSSQIAAQQEELEKMSTAATMRDDAEERSREQQEQLNAIAREKAQLQERDAERLRDAGNHDKEQQQLANAAERLFRGYDFKEAVKVASPSLRQFQLELRGKDSDKIIGYLERKDYLGLLGILNGRTYSEYPNTIAMNEAKSKLDRYPFKVLLTTGSSETRASDGRSIVLITLREPTDLRYIDVPVSDSTDWSADPSGRGIYTDWSPNQGDAIVALLDRSELHQQIEKSRKALMTDLEGIKRGFELGDYSEDGARDLVKQKIKDSYISLYQWIAAQP